MTDATLSPILMMQPTALLVELASVSTGLVIFFNDAIRHYLNCSSKHNHREQGSRQGGIEHVDSALKSNGRKSAAIVQEL